MKSYTRAWISKGLYRPRFDGCGCGEMLLKIVRADPLCSGAHRHGEEGKERIGGEVPPNGLHLRRGCEALMHGEDALADTWYGFDVRIAIGHGKDGKDARTRSAANNLHSFLTGAAVRDGDMPAKTQVDIVHPLPEDRSVG